MLTVLVTYSYFLGLRTLTVINDAVEEIKKNEPDFEISKIPLDYKGVFEEMSAGNTVGIFQCESAGMTNLIVNMKPERFSDIAAAIALYRPGPMFFIDTYLDNRKNPEHISYRTPELKDILDETNGCMVYQEQVMQVFRTLAGYSYGRADVVRRAMSKKKRDVMENERAIFINGLKNENGEIVIEGAVRRGIDEKTAGDVFSDMISFASYGFNKSHTAAYGLVAYQTAYLKIRYPKAFMAALLTSVIGDVTKTSFYINECQRLKISVLPPHINHSNERFSVNDEVVVFPLLAIKNIGRALIQKIVRTRAEDGAFKSYWDFCKRVSGPELNRRALECLIKAGALDGLDLNRCEMLRNIDIAVESAAKENSMYAGGQLDMFSVFGGEDFSSEPQFTRCDELPKNEILNFEKEVSGLYFSGHPLEEYKTSMHSLRCPRTVDLYEYIETNQEKLIDNQKVNFISIVNSSKKKFTKRDEIMAFCELEDLYGSIEMIVFPKVYAEFSSLLFVGNIILVEGRISVKDDEIKLLAEKISAAPKTVEIKSKTENSNKKKGLFIRVSDADKISVLKNLLSIFEGKVPVYLYYTDKKSYEFMGSEYLTDVNDPLVKELKLIFGDENVVLRV